MVCFHELPLLFYQRRVADGWLEKRRLLVYTYLPDNWLFVDTDLTDDRFLVNTYLPKRLFGAAI